MYKCPNCGGEMEFIPERGIIKCSFCDSEFSPEAYDQESEKKQRDQVKQERKNAQENDLPEGKVYTCSQCGASLFTTEETGVTFCSYCGSQAFLNTRVMGESEIAPDMIIPFKISKEQCQEIYNKKIKTAWFIPSSMKSASEIEKFRGIYMPCWVYDGKVDVSGRYKSIKSYTSGGYDITETYEVSANGSGRYGGFLMDSTASFPDDIMRKISPFPAEEARDFNDKYMTGFYADIGNVPSDVYEPQVNSLLDACAKDDLASRQEMKNAGVGKSQVMAATAVDKAITKVEKGFVPVWFLSGKNKLNGKMSYAVINGLNGKIHADLPIDMKKYLLVSLAIAVVFFAFLQAFTLKPGTMLLAVLLLLGILVFTSARMVRESYIRENGLDDAGLQYLKSLRGEKSEDVELGAGKVRKSISNAAKWTLFSVILIVGIPVLGSVLSYIFNVNAIGYVMLFAVIVFIVFVCSGKKKDQDTEGEVKLALRNIKIPFMRLLKGIMFPLLGMLVGIAVLIADPALDAYYYAAVIFDCAMLILTMLEYVRYSNKMALRKPAQLGKRGGDENA